jgi:hypothetical protein
MLAFALRYQYEGYNKKTEDLKEKRNGKKRISKWISMKILRSERT